MNGPPTPLDRLATGAGIALSYRTLDGGTQVVGDDTKRALLAAMGIDAETDTAVAAALADLDRSRERPLPHVVTATVGADVTVPLTLSASDKTRPVEWVVETEDGDTVSGRSVPDGRETPVLTLDLPEPLPAGYHRLTLDLAHDDRAAALIVAPPRAFGLADLGCAERLWGVAAPLYGLRSSRSWGIGDFADLDTLMEAAAEAGAALLGINPVHALFPARSDRFSPYSPSSRLYFNSLHIAPDAAPVKGADKQDPEQARAALNTTVLVDYAGTAALKFRRLDELYRRFRSASGAADGIKSSFDKYVQSEGITLYRHALYEALSEHFDGPEQESWRDWPHAYQAPETPEVEAFAAQHRDRMERSMFQQWLASYQLAAVQARALERGMPIGLYGDLAVGVDPGGADAWAHQHFYARGVSLGAPPDQFSPAGQEWGLVPMLPSALAEWGLDPFIDILQRTMQHMGALRIDHALGLERCFWVPRDGRAPGSYVRYPLDDLLAVIRLESHRNRCVVIGEDLGNVPAGLRAALTDSGLLGYRVFAFERGGDDGFRPASAYPAASLAAATTHDLPTTRGAWLGRDIDWRVRVGHLEDADDVARARADCAETRRAVLRRLSEDGLLPDGLDPEDPPEEMPDTVLDAIHRFLARTPAAIALVQYEDMIGEIEQPNLPGTVEQHPNWRRRPGPPLEDLATDPGWRRLATVMEEERGSTLS